MKVRGRSAIMGQQRTCDGSLADSIWSDEDDEASPRAWPPLSRLASERCSGRGDEPGKKETPETRVSPRHHRLCGPQTQI